MAGGADESLPLFVPFLSGAAPLFEADVCSMSAQFPKIRSKRGSHSNPHGFRLFWQKEKIPLENPAISGFFKGYCLLTTSINFL